MSGCLSGYTLHTVYRNKLVIIAILESVGNSYNQIYSVGIVPGFPVHIIESAARYYSTSRNYVICITMVLETNYDWSRPLLTMSLSG